MSNRAEYLALTRLINNADYKVLEAKWMYLISKMETSRDNAAARGQEGAWRYYAGQEKGAKTIMMALMLAIRDLEEQDEELASEKKYDSLLDEIRGERKP